LIKGRHNGGLIYFGSSYRHCQHDIADHYSTITKDTPCSSILKKCDDSVMRKVFQKRCNKETRNIMPSSSSTLYVKANLTQLE
jgi:hypothetical protein